MTDAVLSEVEAKSSTAPKSMTGYADIAGETSNWSWTMELRGVNGRGLDIRIRAPEWIDGFDARARKKLQTTLSRGSVTLNLRVSSSEASDAGQVDHEALSAVMSNLATIEAEAARAGLELCKTSAAEILAMKGVTDLRDDRADTGTLSAALDAALETLIKDFGSARRDEGAALEVGLSEKLSEIERLTDAATEAAGERGKHQKDALEAALARLLDATKVPDEARLLQEMAVIAVKTDITEELDRLRAHIGAARTLMKTSGPIGRKFDFLMQEFNREANTLCSKSQSPALTSIGLDLKTVIDQMREQVQNIE